jgi:hypothetical protein
MTATYGPAHALDDRAGNKSGGDHAERRLITREQDVGDRAFRIESHAPEEGVIQSAQPIPAGRKREGVADEGPGDPNEAKGDVTHHHGVERVLRSDESAIEESEGWRHHQHEGGGHEHPRGIRLIDGGGGHVGAILFTVSAPRGGGPAKKQNPAFIDRNAGLK